MPDEYLELLKRAKASLPEGKEHVRLEIPKAQATISGRQTFVRNFLDIAKAVRRDPKHIAKYLFKELAAPGSLGNELVLQGKFSYDVINKRIDNYVKEFVLCKECGKPDTNLLKHDKIWTVKCEACGAKKPARAI